MSLVRGQVRCHVHSLAHNHEPDLAGETIVFNPSLLDDADRAYVSGIKRMCRGQFKRAHQLTKEYLQQKLGAPIEVCWMIVNLVEFIR